MRFWLGASLLVPAQALAAPATVQQAQAREQAADTAGARDLFEQALAEGGNDPEGLRVTYRELGMLRAAASDPAGAEEAFAALLSLDPAFALPPDASPVATAALARARDARGEEPPLGLEVT